MIPILVSLLPVFAYLGALIFLDSYKLVRLSSVLWTILAGIIAGLVSYIFVVSALSSIEGPLYSMYGAPIIEEVLKGSFLLYLIKKRKIGFMVDAAIYGFAIGAGFSFLENLHYLRSISSSNLFLWVVRGFGTAIMHGGTTALFGIFSKSLSDRYSSERLHLFLPGLILAMIIHSFYNHFFFSPQISTVIILVGLPAVFLFVFSQSEKATRNWLGIGFDTDMELLQMITTGNISRDKIGLYLQSLKKRFPGEVVADMLCLLRIHVELSMRAKGVLLMREAGFRSQPDPEIKEKFQELRYLEKNIGKTGQLAISPFLHKSSRDLWQLYMLGEK